MNALACLLALLPTPLLPQDAPAASAAPLGPLTRLLVVEPSAPRQRSPLATDPVELQLVRGAFRAPSEGDPLELPDGRRLAWRSLSSPDGAYEDRALRGGWAYARVASAEQRVLLLEARGHAWVYVDGEPRYGDVYDLGLTRVPVVVRPEGTELLFKGGRGRLSASLAEPPGACFVDVSDLTLPDVVRGVQERSQAGVLVTNATAAVQRELLLHAALEVAGEAAFLSTLRIPRLLPLESRKVALPLPLSFELDPNVRELTLLLSLTQVAPDDREKQDLRHQARIRLAVREPGEAYRVTFVSDLDDSVQEYAIRPAQPPPPPGQPAGLALTLHGAGVDSLAQASSYSARPWVHVVAPTNRRPFGFDWEDWGRANALQTLYVAAIRLGSDPTRTYLTGHSMGGHGAWNLGAQFPALFAAVAPSAGWSDFWSYGGAWEAAADSRVEQLLARAANGSRTALLLRNLAPRGVYVLHGQDDRNVPVEQARALRAALSAFHTDLEYHEQPGAGHWWGNECVDWPPLFEFLGRHRLPPPNDVLRVDFTTVNPAVSARMDWITLEAQARWMAPSRIEAVCLPEQSRIELRTENVARLLIELGLLAEPRRGAPAHLSAGQTLVVDIDQQELEIEWPAGARLLRLARSPADGSWNAEGDVSAWRKGPQRAGPFKEAFGNHMVFVYGTQGEPAENAWAFAKARYDAEAWRYRANGAVEVQADVDFSVTIKPDRNVIVYGHSQMVAGWSQLIASGAWEVGRGRLRVGGRTLERDDLALLVVYPRKGSDVASVGVVAGTGPEGLRLTHQLPYFLSGVGYPDWTVLAPEMLAVGGAGVLGAGYFGENWTVDSGDFAWQPDLDGGR